MNSFGKYFKFTLIGSSHGKIVGVVIDGVPVGKTINPQLIQSELNKRRPGQSKVTTPRKEKDELVIETGLENNITNGEPIFAYVQNNDVDSRYYEEIKNTPRPGHADYPARIKYKGKNDHRGGGRFSGRMTIGLVIAGEIAKQLISINNLKVVSYTKSIGKIVGRDVEPDEHYIYSDENIVRSADKEVVQPQIDYIISLKGKGDSCGGIVETFVTDLPVGVGEPWFDSIESELSHLLFSIPAVKGVEFGRGFEATKMLGSEHNDEFEFDEGRVQTKTNNAGGILGGLSNGMPIVFRTAFKPTSSIRKVQQTVNLEDNSLTKLKVKGRHDPCIVPRAVPVVKAVTYCVVYDLLRRGGFE